VNGGDRPDAGLGRVRDLYDGALDPAVQVRTLAQGERLFPVREVACGPTSSELPAHANPVRDLSFESAGRGWRLEDVLALGRVAGLLILKDGAIALERYRLGIGADTRWTSMSLAKTITAALVGAAIHDGFIASVDDPVGAHVRELARGAYAGVTIRQLLQMASGVAWDETYTLEGSDRRRMLDAQIAQRPGAILNLMARLPRRAPAGTVWNYSTGETFVAGALVRAAAARPLADYLSEKIWIPCGMQTGAAWWLESPGGVEIGGSGLHATLRDYARFGLLLLHDGVAGGARILPEGWVREAGSPQRIGAETVAYGYMTWPLGDARPVNAGAFQAIGIFGQHLYVNPRERVVIVVAGALPRPSGAAPLAMEDFFAAATLALR
jgi:CubicO group peptidase (beta-lactamase class C family)